MSKKITVHNSENNPIYEIFLEEDFNKLSEAVKALGYENRRFCVVTDSNVGPLYAEKIESELKSLAAKVCVFTFDAGEASKNLDVVKDLYKFLIEENFDRKDVMFALGGGVVGDLTGFTAATYLRGIDFIQIPTSLLAMVDSSVGGKTGVDFDAYKNMVGAFYQPKLVYMNLKVIDSLDLRQYYAGLAEVLKYGLIRNEKFYVWMIENLAEVYVHEPEVMEKMIETSCNMKRVIVERDATEKGERALLNFGHTIGHAIEKLKNFELLHGECVALGMIAAAHISWKREYISTEEFFEFRDMIVGFRLPASVDGLAAEDILATTKTDKKMDAGKIRFVLLKDIGNAYIDTTVSDEEIIEAANFLLMDLED